MLTDEQIEALKVVTYPHPVLTERAKEIVRLDDWVEKLVRRMWQIMHERRGVGLAGNQVGLALRLFTFNETGEPEDDRVLINPEIIDEQGWAEGEEGCLSLPEVYVKVRRRRRVVIEGLDLTGKKVQLDLADLPARIMQHELDHLEGTMIHQRISPISKLTIRRRLKELETAFQHSPA